MESGAFGMSVRHSHRSARAAVVGLAVLAAACVPPQNERGPRLTMVIGIDVSGSFQNTGHFSDALNFAAHYIYGHLNGLGELDEPAALFVGSIGGERVDEPKSFHPIHDFRDKSVEEIERDLREWFQPDDRFTDFNPFFDRVGTLVRRQNLILKPLTVVVISDGIPDVTARTAARGPDARYEQIDLSPLELLSRNVTVRLLYANPGVIRRWEREVPRQRVRMWTVDGEVMEGWREQLANGRSLDQQHALWEWIADIVDFRVRRRLL